MARGGRPPLFFGCARPPHPLLPPTRGGLDGRFSDRTPRPARCTRPRHCPSLAAQRPHTDVGPSPTATRRIAASSVRHLAVYTSMPHSLIQDLLRGKDTTASAIRKVILHQYPNCAMCPSKACDDLGADLLIRTDDFSILFGVELRGKFCGVHEIAEHDRELPTFSVRRSAVDGVQPVGRAVPGQAVVVLVAQIERRLPGQFSDSPVHTSISPS